MKSTSAVVSTSGRDLGLLLKLLRLGGVVEHRQVVRLRVLDNRNQKDRIIRRIVRKSDRENSGFVLAQLQDADGVQVVQGPEVDAAFVAVVLSGSLATQHLRNKNYIIQRNFDKGFVELQD